MHIDNHQLIDGTTVIDLPQLPYAATVRAWRVPADYRANEVFVSVKRPGKPWDVPACAGALLELEAELPEHPAAVAAAVFAKKQEQAEAMIEHYIMAPIHAYNAEHNTKFASVHSCANYARVDGYTHQEFCSNVWLWSVQVWESARQILHDIMTGQRTEPTPEEFLAELPEFLG